MQIQQGQQANTYFCYMFIKFVQQAYIAIVLAVLTVGLLIYAIKQYLKTKRFSIIGRNIRFIYIAIYFWAIFYIIKIVLSEIIFWIQNGHPDPEDPNKYTQYETASKILFSVDLTAAFFIQGVLILVCFNWMDNIVMIFNQLSQMEDKSDVEIQKSKDSFKFQRTCKIILAFYLYVRFIFFIIVVVFLFAPNQYIQILFYLMMSLLLFETVVVLIFFSLGIFAIKKNKKLAQIVDQKEIELMVRKYAILIFCVATRCGVDLVFVIRSIQYQIKQTTCYINNNASLGYNIAFIVLQGFLTHCLSAFIVLRIYRVQQSKIDLTESLLAAQNNNQSVEGVNIQNFQSK